MLCVAKRRSSAALPLSHLFNRSLCSLSGEAGVCSNGINGVESDSGDYCCPTSCGVCDGADCAADGEGCCGDVIEKSGVMCDDSETAPCIIDGTPHKYIIRNLALLTNAVSPSPPLDPSASTVLSFSNHSYDGVALMSCASYFTSFPSGVWNVPLTLPPLPFGFPLPPRPARCTPCRRCGQAHPRARSYPYHADRQHGW